MHTNLRRLESFLAKLASRQRPSDSSRQVVQLVRRPRRFLLCRLERVEQRQQTRLRLARLRVFANAQGAKADDVFMSDYCFFVFDVLVFDFLAFGSSVSELGLRRFWLLVGVVASGCSGDLLNNIFCSTLLIGCIPGLDYSIIIPRARTLVILYVLRVF